MLLGAAGFYASAQGSQIQLADETFRMDTIFHAKVGPGTTQTSVRLEGAHPLNVFYLTIDLTTPNVSLRTVCGPKLAGNSTVRNMARNNSSATTQYFAGVNGDFYWTSGKASNGSSQVGTPTNACIVDGEVFKSSNSSYQFTVDTEGIARISRLNFYRGMASKGETTAEFHGINVGSPANSLTLYTPRFWGSSNQGDYAGNCAEVTARLVEGETFAAGTKYKLEITSLPNSSGDTTVPDDGFVLFGRGDNAGVGTMSAKAFVESLVPGDIVEIDNAIYTAEGEKIVPLQCVSGNPKNVGGGVNLDSEGERGDAKDRHPRTGIGISADGKKIVMMVIDGRSVNSAGVTTGMLGDMLIVAGCHEGVNLDGGGSSTLFTEALGVRNHCSDGSERAVGNAIFATVDGNITDTEVAEIQFAAWRADAPALGIYSPVVYAFNAAGVMIDSDYRDFTLSCPPELGTISEDGRQLYTSDSGKGVLTATAGTAKTSIPVYISAATPKAALSRVILDGQKTFAPTITPESGGDYLIRNSAFDWESSDTETATVDADGNVSALTTGTATITGRRGDKELSYTVDVQIPTVHNQPLAENIDFWTIKKTSLSTLNPTWADGTLTLDYTMPATPRNPQITLRANTDLWSRPDKIHISANYDAAPTSIELNVRAANSRTITTFTASEIPAEGLDRDFVFADMLDTADDAVYPLYLTSIVIAPSEKGNQSGHISLPRIELIYDCVASVDNIAADSTGSECTCWFNLMGMPVDGSALSTGVYIRLNRGKAEKVIVK